MNPLAAGNIQTIKVLRLIQRETQQSRKADRLDNKDDGVLEDRGRKAVRGEMELKIDAGVTLDRGWEDDADRLDNRRRLVAERRRLMSDRADGAVIVVLFGLMVVAQFGERNPQQGSEAGAYHDLYPSVHGRQHTTHCKRFATVKAVRMTSAA